MAEKTTEAAKKPSGDAGAGADAAPAAHAAAGSSGLKAWMPVLLTILLMPALAFVTTRYVLLPHVQKALLQQASGASSEPSTPSEKPGEAPPAGPEGKSTKVTVPLTKVLVNVAGTLGSRYLIISMTLVGAGGEFKNQIDGNKDQLLDLAQGALSSKTIADLERPDARNLIRSELMNTFNNALGGPVIKEIYFTEWAIQ